MIKEDVVAGELEFDKDMKVKQRNTPDKAGQRIRNGTAFVFFACSLECVDSIVALLRNVCSGTQPDHACDLLRQHLSILTTRLKENRSGSCKWHAPQTSSPVDLPSPTGSLYADLNGKGKKREVKDAKFGFGGRKKLQKQNTAESSADMNALSRDSAGRKSAGRGGRGGGSRGGGGGRGGGRGGNTGSRNAPGVNKSAGVSKRPGKNARQAGRGRGGGGGRGRGR